MRLTGRASNVPVAGKKIGHLLLKQQKKVYT